MKSSAGKEASPARPRISRSAVRAGAALPAPSLLLDRIRSAFVSVRIPRRADARWSESLATDVGEALFIGGAYYLAAYLGLRLALVGGQVTPIWPSTGIAL